MKLSGKETDMWFIYPRRERSEVSEALKTSFMHPLYKYTLEPYKGAKTRHICPQCNKKAFTRYIDTESLEYLGEHIGRCNREIHCGYHYKPAQYFLDNNLGYTHPKKDVFGASFRSPCSQKTYIPLEILQKSRIAYNRNSFVTYLRTLFDARTVSKLIGDYHLGTSGAEWPGACIFWFIDIKGRIHAGQVKLFKPNGHTAEIEGQKATTWIHSILKKKLTPIPSWLVQYCDQERKVSCLFGEHLIGSKPIAIVEAPATAIVASEYLPHFTWLASGSLSYLNKQRCEVLKGKKVVLYPDLGAYNKWKAVADELGFDCSSLLEEIATDQDKERGLDLRDYLERININDFNKPKEFALDGTPIGPKGYPLSWDIEQTPLQKMIAKNPAIEELITRLGLEQIN